MNSATRNRLRSLAHPLKPVVMIGKNGLNEQVLAAIDSALTDHELIKVKFQDFKEARKEISTDITQQLQADLVSLIGNIAILFRQNRDPEKRKIAIVIK